MRLPCAPLSVGTSVFQTWKGCPMNSLKYSLVALALLCLGSGAKAEILYFEDFESFIAGTVLHQVSDWEGWYGDAAAAAIVSDKFAFSGTKSVEADSSADAVHLFDVTEGKWVLTVMQYIPSGTTGTTRFHMQNTYGASIGRSVQWSFALNDRRDRRRLRQERVRQDHLRQMDRVEAGHRPGQRPPGTVLQRSALLLASLGQQRDLAASDHRPLRQRRLFGLLRRHQDSGLPLESGQSP